MQRARAVLVARVGVRAPLQQLRHAHGGAARHCVDQDRPVDPLALAVLPDGLLVDQGAARARADLRHLRRDAALPVAAAAHVRVGAVRDELPHARDALGRTRRVRRDVERPQAVAVLGRLLDIGARLEQEIEQRRLVARAGNVQRRRAVVVARVGVGVRGQQDACRPYVAHAHGVRQLEALLARRDHVGGEQRRRVRRPVEDARDRVLALLVLLLAAEPLRLLLGRARAYKGLHLGHGGGL